MARQHNTLNPGILRLPERSPLPGLLQRLGFAVAIIIIVSICLWFDRGGLRDNAHPDRPMSFADVFYFTVVSLTTVGYGDIAPVTTEARLVNAILLTPIRVFLLALFLGTAYQLIFLHYLERVKMNQLRTRLSGHIIVCGFGVKGRAIVTELLAHGHKHENILVIEPDNAAVEEATAQNLVALRGEASSEAILRSAAVEKAGHVIVGPNRDDVCVLICLTVRALNPSVQIVASAREDENVKLIYRAGADLVVAPSVSGGRLMAAAVRQRAVPEFLEDILAFGRGIDATERPVRADEAGLRPSDLPDLAGTLILGVKRGEERCPFYRLKDYLLQPGDIIVYLVGSPSASPGPGPAS